MSVAHRYRLHPYPVRLIVRVYAADEHMRLVERLGEAAVAATGYRPSGHVTVYIRRNAQGTARAHEAVHAATFALQHSGVDITEGNSEALAYLTGHIYGRILQAQRAVVV